jgi:hypothetical protein
MLGEHFQHLSGKQIGNTPWERGKEKSGKIFCCEIEALSKNVENVKTKEVRKGCTGNKNKNKKSS